MEIFGHTAAVTNLRFFGHSTLPLRQIPLLLGVGMVAGVAAVWLLARAVFDHTPWEQADD